MYIKKHSKKFHVSHLGAAPGGVIFIIALLENSKQIWGKFYKIYL